MLLLLSAALADPFTEWLEAPYPVAAGFHVPTTEAAAAGRVVRVAPGEVEVAHTWYENAARRSLVVRYEGITPRVAVGDAVDEGQPLGAGVQAVRFYTDGAEVDPGTFVQRRARLAVPAEEPALLLVSHAAYEARLYRRGVEVARYPVSFGQEKGAKHRRGDNRTPVGMYFVVAKSTGPFSGPVADYYAGHWIKIDYPNPWDADYGVARGWIPAEVAEGVRAAWEHRRLTAQDTVLGGGIGLHGWAWEWPEDGPRHLSWGCVVFEPSDVAAVYEQLPTGAMVVLF